MKMFRWQKGRQEATASIDKLPLWNWFGFDVYLLWFPVECHIEAHKDKVPFKEHHRINITLSGAWMLRLHKKKLERIYMRRFQWHQFRPDKIKHSAHAYANTYILSIGWTKPIQ